MTRGSSYRLRSFITALVSSGAQLAPEWIIFNYLEAVWFDVKKDTAFM
jgi:hypothetical protein